MRRTLAGLAFLLLAAPGAFPQTASAPVSTNAEQQLAGLVQASSLTQENLRPWHLKMSFTIFDPYGQRGKDGTLEEWWTPSGARRIVVSAPGYTEACPGACGAGEDTANRTRYLIYQLRNQIESPVPDHLPAHMDVQLEDQTFGKTKLACVVATAKNEGGTTVQPQEFCTEPTTNTLRVSEDGKITFLRDGLGRFQNKIVALRERILYEGRPEISGRVDTLESFDPTKASIELSDPRPGGLQLPGGVEKGNQLHSEAPVYPALARSEHIFGTVYLTCIISKEGRIDSVDVLSSPDYSLTDSAEAAVKHWTYKPYLLHGQPTNVLTTILVNYNLH